jgi:uncharacterized circularly permuted ATP-grasp superfamily protein
MSSFAPIPYDEMLTASDGAAQISEYRTHGVRPHYEPIQAWLQATELETLEARHKEAELLFRRVGITFAVYGDDGGTERTIPFDILPRIFPASQWQLLEAGLIQRVQALNMFLHDVYHEQHILKAGIIEPEQVLHNAQYREQMQSVAVPLDIYAHIAGIDIIRASYGQQHGQFFVLEDNLRVPSGVSYMIENRKMMMRLFPSLFGQNRIAPVEHYPDLLLNALQQSAPQRQRFSNVVVLTPGMYNSAYFEHAFLAQQMGVELVEGQDLFVDDDDMVYMRTTQGPQPVDVIYRRVDDDFLDPRAFRADSVLGPAGLMRAYRAGNVAICNAVGTGVADDKSIYPYVPDMIRFYLSQEPILHNVPTYLCRRPKELSYVLANLKDLVVKEVHGAGGYGMLIGPASSQKEIESFRQRLLANPHNYIAQPTLSLSTSPTFVNAGIAPRHIDLRPFVLSGKQVRMVAGGLTRVALAEGSLIVNSSQGGGTKDTWILQS